MHHGEHEELAELLFAHAQLTASGDRQLGNLRKFVETFMRSLTGKDYKALAAKAMKSSREERGLE